MPNTKSLSQHKAFPSSQSSLLLGDFRGFAKAVHYSKADFLSFGCLRCCWKQSHRLHCADWGTVQIVHGKVRRSGRGRIVVWASFYPGSMARRKGWLVCPISKRCHVFGYRDKSSASRRRELPLSREKRNKTPVYLSEGRHWAVLRNVSLRHFFISVLKQTRLIEEQTV